MQHYGAQTKDCESLEEREGQVAAPNVFVSSTFVDLKHLRDHVEQFIKSMGYNPILFEFGGIGFDFKQPLDESCYDEVKSCDIFVLIIGGRYGSPVSDEVRNKSKKYMSITRKEYETAIKSGVPVYTFVDAAVLNERRTYNKNKGNKTIQYASVDDTQIFDFIDHIYEQKKNNYIKGFSSLDDIISDLRGQFAAIVKRAVNAHQQLDKGERVAINSFKLFFYRYRRKLSQPELASEVGITVQEYRNLERVRYWKRFAGYDQRYFPLCSRSILNNLESVLKMEGKLAAGQRDDFTAMFMEFYAENRGKKARASFAKTPLLSFGIKAVVFDFDGTITASNNGRTTWEMIWEHLGYDVNECAHYHTEFRKNNITHPEWCAITLQKFKDKKFSEAKLDEVAGKIRLHAGFEELVRELVRRNIKLHIVSGSIRQIIRKTIGNLAIEFDEIKANEMQFDKTTGEIVSITGTAFDFEGKPDYLKRLVTEMGCSPMDILFVGNAGNDGWVSQSGVRTLCVNPASTDADNAKMWWDNIREMKDMREILDKLEPRA